jgi:hypothetical protein
LLFYHVFSITQEKSRVSGLPTIHDFFSESAQVLDLKGRSVIEHQSSTEFPKDLMLIRLQEEHFRVGVTIQDGLKVQGQTLIAAGETPRFQITFMTLFILGNLKRDVVSLCPTPSTKIMFSVAAEVSPNP